MSKLIKGYYLHNFTLHINLILGFCPRVMERTRGESRREAESEFFFLDRKIHAFISMRAVFCLVKKS